ncbi:peptide chain release factor N(5)-glutamine methyltransferase [Rubritalea profundi]|uniref:Release factor glutamine methyltransferase n=1 Tax=Rubritalea profundi TaxID=1658618 RepID=A0A2S7U721_9BACT|nr:peptide chain release factor N(5)-glutamine methyltransferase [Rubritalea profundi]PQJ30003.1 protein-(glutamine-N5) methyltransferase, release factor-specific [Rubritalea profundi]
MKTILETLDSGTQWLEKKGVDDARRNMQLLLCHQLDCSKIQLYTRFDEPMSEESLIPLRGMLKRRGNREPLQHILGTVEFYMRDFYTDSRALIPRPETEELCEIVLKQLSPVAPSKILDMGTGSGVIGITLALEYGSQSKVSCVDISEDALELAQKNITSNGAENCAVQRSNLFEGLDSKYDLIVANLPYVPEVDRSSLAAELTYDPDIALYSGKDGLDIIREFIQKCQSSLEAGGTIALEIGIHQNVEVEKLLANEGFSDIKTFPDLSGIYRFPTARWSGN